MRISLVLDECKTRLGILDTGIREVERRLNRIDALIKEFAKSFEHKMPKEELV